MAMTDAERIFIDTNVLVAHTITEAPGHTDARR
jgi:predicted nucleic acid-binding protein